MRHALKLHPDSRCVAATQIEADVARPSPGRLTLRYVLSGTLRDLRVPPPAAAERADELWQHTCFEAFVSASPGGAYYELNFAPSLQWAAYRFGGYRSAMCVAHEIAAPRIAVKSNGASLALEAALELPGLASDPIWHLGLSAVIEETNGQKSYWALAHPPGKADFHHSDCFVLELAGA